MCYVSTGLASSSTQLTDLSGEIIQRHQNLAKALTVDNVTDTLSYIVNKLLKAKCAQSSPIIDPSMTNSCNNHINNGNGTKTRVPAVHLKVFYQVSSTPPINLIIQTISEFREQNADRVSIAFSVLPASSLHNFSTFLSIYGIRHAWKFQKQSFNPFTHINNNSTKQTFFQQKSTQTHKLNEFRIIFSLVLYTV